MTDQLQKTIDTAWENRAEFSPKSAPREVVDAVEHVERCIERRHREDRWRPDPHRGDALGRPIVLGKTEWSGMAEPAG